MDLSDLIDLMRMVLPQWPILFAGISLALFLFVLAAGRWERNRWG